jgi:predicted metalloprotease with PDZ domain
VDVVPGTPAWDAGVAPGMTLIAVDGLKFSKDRLRDSIRGTKDKPAPVRLLLQNGESYFEASIPVSGGERYPKLERDPARPDLLGAILAPKSR